MKAGLSALAVCLCGIFLGLIGFVAARGWGSLSWAFLWDLPMRAGQLGGIRPVLLSTVILVVIALGIALPLGVGAALYVSEFASDGAPVRMVRTLTEALAGVPSIIFGLFGFSLFVIRLGWGWSLASGGVTLALMLLPTMIRTTEQSLAAVPIDQREGALSLGATRWEAVRRVVLRQAAPGILTGAVLSLGRAVGETAVVLLTAGSDLGMPTSPFQPGRSLALHLYMLASEGISEGRAYAVAFILITGMLVINSVASFFSARLHR